VTPLTGFGVLAIGRAYEKPLRNPLSDILMAFRLKSKEVKCGQIIVVNASQINRH
jgi:hypothetical protein